MFGARAGGNNAGHLGCHAQKGNARDLAFHQVRNARPGICAHSRPPPVRHPNWECVDQLEPAPRTLTPTPSLLLLLQLAARAGQVGRGRLRVLGAPLTGCSAAGRIAFLPGDSPYLSGLKWSGLSRRRLGRPALRHRSGACSGVGGDEC